MALTENARFTNARAAFRDVDDGVYRYCAFDGFSADGTHVGAVYLGCTFTSVDWYWAFFNCAVFVSCEFRDCVFRGASFEGCKVVDSTFIRCRFLADNVGGLCKSAATQWYGCTATDCEGWESVLAR